MPTDLPRAMGQEISVNLETVGDFSEEPNALTD